MQIAAPKGRSPVGEPSVVVADLGGANLKLWCSSTGKVAAAPTGPAYAPQQLIFDIERLTEGWPMDFLTIGVPTGIAHGRCQFEPHNLGPGWVDADLQAAFQVPAQVVNDALIQAVGSYAGGRMLFLGLGTGLGTTLVVDGVPIGLELMHLPYRDGFTYEDFAATRGVERLGVAAWRLALADIVRLLKMATVAEHVVLGGGNTRLLDGLPDHCRLGDNANAFVGGWRLWAGPEADLEIGV